MVMDILKFLRRLNEGHLRSLDFKKVEIVKKKNDALVHNFNFKSQFNPSDLLKAQSL